MQTDCVMEGVLQTHYYWTEWASGQAHSLEHIMMMKTN